MAVLSPSRAGRALALAFALLLGAGVALFAAVSLRTLAYPHEVIVTEGAIGLAVDSVRAGVPLYDPVRWRQAPFVIVHYTPLYYLVTAAVDGVVGGHFLAGRLVSVAGTAVTALLALVFVRRRTGRIAPGLIAAALWLSFYQVVFWGTTQRVDALAIAFEAAGLLAYAAARRTGGAGYRALPWFVLAWATKQVMVVGLAAATLDLFLADRRRGLRLALAGAGSLALLFVLWTWWSGGGFWTAAVLGTVSGRADPPWVIFLNAELFFASPWNLVAVVAATWGAALLRPREGARFLALYLWLGLAVAVATDANLPRFFPPMLAMALLVPLLLERLRHAPAVRAAVLFLLVLALASHSVYEMRSLVRERLLSLHPGNQRLSLARAVERHTTGDGPVLAQDVGMLLSAGRPVTVADPYVFSILAGNGAWRPDQLVAGIAARRYQAVILNRPLEALDDREWTTLWIAPARAALAENYRLSETVTIDERWRFLEPTRYIYVPR